MEKTRLFISMHFLLILIVHVVNLTETLSNQLFHKFMIFDHETPDFYRTEHLVVSHTYYLLFRNHQSLCHWSHWDWLLYAIQK